MREGLGERVPSMREGDLQGVYLSVLIPLSPIPIWFLIPRIILPQPELHAQASLPFGPSLAPPPPLPGLSKRTATAPPFHYSSPEQPLQLPALRPSLCPVRVPTVGLG